jgi:lysylphosphatidylglycerol synthetase-like protein (DUF2156 family)
MDPDRQGQTGVHEVTAATAAVAVSLALGPQGAPLIIRDTDKILYATCLFVFRTDEHDNLFTNLVPVLEPIRQRRPRAWHRINRGIKYAASAPIPGRCHLKVVSPNTVTGRDGTTLVTTERLREHLPPERAIANEIVRQYARTPLDLFKLWPDKSYFFSPSERCVIAYRVAHNTAIALGDPVGPELEIGTTAREFLEMCRAHRWAAAFYQVLPDFLAAYRRLGMKKLKIGDDAMVDLFEFSLHGKSKRELRSKVRQLEAAGIQTREFQPPVPDDVLAQLKTVSDEWLQIPGRRERSFTLGQFDPDYLRSKPVLVVFDGAGCALAFINLISVDGNEITGDLMRRRGDAPNGIMDYLFLKLFLHARQRGYARVSLGMAPMTGFRDHEHATLEERAIHGLFQKLDFLFSFRGLYHYKAKFATSWEPRYLIYRSVAELPRTALALRRLSEIAKEKNEPGAAQKEPGIQR